MQRAAKSGVKLSVQDASIAKAMIERGDRQHDIAAYFGVNGGRIGEIATGYKFSEVKPSQEALPPPGPYLNGRDSLELLEMLKELKRQKRRKS